MAVTWDQVEEGQELPVLKKNCTTQQLVQWAAGSGDFYQIHYDKDFAIGTGLKGIIVHGALKNAFLGQAVHDWIGNNAASRSTAAATAAWTTRMRTSSARASSSRKYEERRTSSSTSTSGRRTADGNKTTPGTATVVFK